jgi:toxin ParE1/3/4
VTPDLFAPSARRELLAAVTWVAQDNEAAANALLAAALQSARRIADRPLLGRARPELLPAPYRFWRIAGFPYVIVYNASRRPPLVLRVLHMARDLAPLLVDLSGTTEDGPPTI